MRSVVVAAALVGVAIAMSPPASAEPSWMTGQPVIVSLLMDVLSFAEGGVGQESPDEASQSGHTPQNVTSATWMRKPVS